MKAFLIAAATLSLAGAAFAQQPTTSTDSTGSPPATTTDGTVIQSGTSNSAGQTTPAQTSSAASAMPAPTMVANMPAGDAPSSYPTCTKRGQDRCTSSGRRGH